MQSIKTAQFLNITILFVLFIDAPAVFGNAAVPLGRMYESL